VSRQQKNEAVGEFGETYPWWARRFCLSHLIWGIEQTLRCDRRSSPREGHKQENERRNQKLPLPPFCLPCLVSGGNSSNLCAPGVISGKEAPEPSFGGGEFVKVSYKTRSQDVSWRCWGRGWSNKLSPTLAATGPAARGKGLAMSLIWVT